MYESQCVSQGFAGSEEADQVEVADQSHCPLSRALTGVQCCDHIQAPRAEEEVSQRKAKQSDTDVTTALQNKHNDVTGGGRQLLCSCGGSGNGLPTVNCLFAGGRAKREKASYEIIGNDVCVSVWKKKLP